MEKCVIAGSGPAGATAAIYMGRAGIAPIMLTGMTRGGQLTTTTDVENYPGFPEGILGHELMNRLLKQAEKFDTDIRQEEVKTVTQADGFFIVETEQGVIETASLIIATGSSPQKLGLESEKLLAGRGVSYCATCDGFFFKDKIIAVVGGGDSALEEAQFLSRFGKKVYVIHRRNRFRASQTMQDKTLSKDNIEPVMERAVHKINGKDKVESIVLEHTETGGTEEKEIDGLFIAIGHIPNSSPFAHIVETDQKGYIKTDEYMHTGIQGIFACGDVVDHVYMQAVTAAGMGCKAGLETVKYIEELEGRGYPTRSDSQ
ncbi:thioredoxin-disulfide reductase [Planctomycetota bacterium]